MLLQNVDCSLVLALAILVMRQHLLLHLLVFVHNEVLQLTPKPFHFIDEFVLIIFIFISVI